MEDQERIDLFNELNSKKKKKKRGFHLPGLLTTILIALILSILFSTFVIQVRQVSGKSMIPTLQDGDKCIVSRCSYLFSKPDYNDIVILDSRVDRTHTIKDDFLDVLSHNAITSFFTGNSSNEHVYFIKRVVGLPGDKISFSKGKLVRNDEVIEEPYVYERILKNPTETVVVPEGYVYVLGDNRNDSKDSRQLGCIPYSNIIGKTIYTF